jgi:glycosyltransferase involved in cell wall biosynthesis
MNNILLLTDKLKTGGAEMYFCKLENHLRDEWLTVYAAAGPGELYDQIQNKRFFIPISSKNHIANLYVLMKQIASLNIDVIHANSLRMLLYAIVIKRVSRRNLKLVYTKHNITILEKKAPLMFTKMLNDHVNQIITVSHFEKENLAQFGIRDERIRTIYNGVDIAHFSFQPKKKTETFHVGILARLSAEKNHALFLRIANEFRDMDHVMFHIAGDGPERTSIKKMIDELHIHHKVKIHGNLSDPYEFICTMDVLLLTSLREVFPMVVLEAMASGTPIVSVDVGGIKEAIVNHETGFLISQHSEKEFAGKIKLLLDDEKLRHVLVTTAREKVERSFSLSNMIHSTSEIYQG